MSDIFEISYCHNLVGSPKSDIKDVIVLAHNKDFFESLSVDSTLCQLTGITDNDLNLIKIGVSAKFTTTSNETMSSLEFTFPFTQTSSTGSFTTTIRKIVIAILPSLSCYSRHNTYTRSHVIASFVKANKGSASDSCLIYLAVEDSSHILGQTCAIGRCFPILNMKSSKKSPNKENVPKLLFHLFIDLKSDVTGIIPPKEELFHLVNSIRLTQRLVDTPPNILTTTKYVHEVETVIEKLRTIITPDQAIVKIHSYISGTDLEAQGFGGIYNVGKASEHPPVFLCLSYVPKGMESVPPVTLVGKGITYDTGGLSIKTPTTSMCGMKTDMGGSAAVFGAFEAIVMSQLKVPVYAILCIAENSISGNAFRNDDIITMLSGKTVEINNTDAEGRLVLADGVYYAATMIPNLNLPASVTPDSSNNLKPAVIIDIATLTGAQGIATGKNHAGIYTNDEQLELLAVAAGKYTGDLVYPLPYCPEFYKNEFRSGIADMKNSVADRTNAQCSCAAQFIGNHIEDYINNKGKWLHIDMAYPATVGDRATGYGAALLYEITKQFQAK